MANKNSSVREPVKYRLRNGELKPCPRLKKLELRHTLAIEKLIEGKTKKKVANER
jgi:hypothetical protein